MAGKDKFTPGQDLPDEMIQLEQAWSAAQTQPAEPAELTDLAVLNMARRALRERKTPLGRFSGRWPSLLGTAAIMVLTISVLIDRWPETPSIQPTAPAKSSLREPDGPRKTAAEVVSEETLETGLERTEDRDEVTDEARTDFRRARRQELKENIPASVDTAAAVQSAAAPEGAENEKRDLEGESRVAEAHAVQAQPESATARSAALGKSKERVGQDKAESGQRSPTETDAEADADLFSPDDDPLLDQDQAYRLDPEAWIAHLRTLRGAADQNRLIQEVEAFREAWPDHALPEDLLPQ